VLLEVPERSYAMRGVEKLRWIAFLVTAGIISCAPAFAGLGVVGTLAGSLNATVEGLSPLPGSTIFAGQHLRVNNGAAVVSTGTGARIVFGRNTSASFPSIRDALAVQLDQGDVSLYVLSGNSKLRLNAGNVSVTPASGFPTLCEVVMMGDFVGVTSKKGSQRVEGNGAPIEVAEGKAVTIRIKTAANPQGAPAGSGGGTASRGGGPSVLTIAALAAGATGAVVGFVGISKANSAENDAKAASATASSATSAAAAAATAATAASQAAAAATAAASSATAAATAAALLAETLNNNIGCLLDIVANKAGQSSPYTPPSGQSCP